MSPAAYRWSSDPGERAIACVHAPERGLNAWDIAAGTLVAQEAGAEVLGLDGEPASPAMIIAANPFLARNLGPRIVAWHREAGLITD